MISIRSSLATFSTRCFFSLAAASLLVASAYADTNVFVDNFEQFSVGTDLSSTNYQPLVGTTVNTLNEGLSTTGTVTNLFGSRGLNVDLAPSPDGNTITYFEYTNALSQTISNTVVTFSWNQMTPSTNLPWVGYAPLLTGTPDPTYFLSFEGGTIYKWTNYYGWVGVGSINPGELTTNRIDYNLLSGTYDYYLNGVTVLANEPIPADYMNTNAVSSLGFAFWSYDNTGRNQFFLDNVVLSVPEPSTFTLILGGLITLVASRRRR